MNSYIIYGLDLDKINQVAISILRRLYNDRRIGGRHTAEHLKKGIPPKFQKYTDKAIKGLVNKGLIIRKPTNYGTQVYLNPKKILEIEDMLGIE